MTSRSKHRDNMQTRRIERAISLVLQGGIVTSTLLLLIGLTMSFIRRDGVVHKLTSYHQITTPDYTFPHTLPSIHTALQVGNSQGYLMLGLLLLILTPILRVAVSVVLFAYERDKYMTLITLCVLGILIGSYFIGMAT